jgi:UDP-glucose 6-dehydrogenase
MNTKKINKESTKIGFIGQGFIGKSYADDFEERGFDVVRYSLDAEYVGNLEKIKECDLVFVAVNAGTKPLAGEKRSDGKQKTYFDDSNIKAVIPLTREGAIVVIKSTLQPGMTKSLQAMFPDRVIMHSPEFLTEMTAKDDAKKPLRNIIGITENREELKNIAGQILKLFPVSDYEKVIDSNTAELIKYGANAFLFTKILFSNLFFEIVEAHGSEWDEVREAIGVDPRIGPHHMDLHLAVDPMGVYKRRGAGRSCFIKDMAALSKLYAEMFGEESESVKMLRAMEYKNVEVLKKFDRYVDIVESVYGKE